MADFESEIRAIEARRLQPANDSGSDGFEAEIANLEQQLRSPTRGQRGLTFPTDTQAALDAASRTLNVRVPDDYVTPEGARMGIRPGVFLDTTTGAGAGTRFQLGLDENQLNQFKWLVSRYGPENVDLSDEGRFILRNQPTPTGGVEDVLVDPVGIEGGDIAQLGSQALPIAAGIGGGLVGGGFGARAGSTLGGGIVRVLSSAAGMAAAQETVGLGQDAITRLIRDHPVDMKSIGAERAKLAAMDFGLGIAAAGAGKFIGKLGEGLLGGLGIKTRQTAADRAQRALAERTGVTRPLTPGEEAESPILLRLESMMAGRPGTSGTMQRMWEAQQKADDELRRVFLGLPRTLSDEEVESLLPRRDLVGQRGLERLRPEVARSEAAEATARADILATGSQEAQRLAGVNLQRPVNATHVGANLRSRAVGDFDAFRAIMRPRYEAFFTRPEVTTRILPGDNLANAARRVEAQFVPAAETAEGVTSLDRFTPAKLRGFLDQLGRLEGSQVGINDLKRIRTGIDDAIAEGVSIPGTDTAALSALREAVDTEISGSLTALDSAFGTRLLSEWNQLNTDYAQGMTRFNRTGVRELLVREGEKGALGNTAIVDRVVGEGASALDNYNAYRDFFGATSSEFQALQTAARQDVLLGSLSDVTPYIRGSTLRTRLRNLRPEVAQELFGANREELGRIGAVLERAAGKTLDAEELHAVARSGTLTASRLQNLIQAEDRVARDYANDLLKAAGRGQLNAETIDPSTFVSRLNAMDPNDAQRIMGAVSGDAALVAEIRQLAVEDIWSQIRAGAFGLKKVSPELLQRTLGDKTRQETWRNVVGQDTLDGLSALLKSVASSSTVAKGFGGSSIAGANDLSQIALHGEIGALPELAVRTLIGFLYSGPMRRSITNIAKGEDLGRVLNSVVASTPFVEHLASRFGSDGALLLMANLRSLIEPLQIEELRQQAGVAAPAP
jgi:hypothetical protein